MLINIYKYCIQIRFGQNSGVARNGDHIQNHQRALDGRNGPGQMSGAIESLSTARRPQTEQRFEPLPAARRRRFRVRAGVLDRKHRPPAPAPNQHRPARAHLGNRRRRRRQNWQKTQP